MNEHFNGNVQVDPNIVVKYCVVKYEIHFIHLDIHFLFNTIWMRSEYQWQYLIKPSVSLASVDKSKIIFNLFQLTRRQGNCTVGATMVIVNWEMEAQIRFNILNTSSSQPEESKDLKLLVRVFHYKSFKRQIYLEWRFS